VGRIVVAVIECAKLRESLAVFIDPEFAMGDWRENAENLG